MMDECRFEVGKTYRDGRGREWRVLCDDGGDLVARRMDHVGSVSLFDQEGMRAGLHGEAYRLRLPEPELIKQTWSCIFKNDTGFEHPSRSRAEAAANHIRDELIGVLRRDFWSDGTVKLHLEEL